MRTYSPLQRRVESRKREVTFTIPVVVPLAPHVRLLENDASFTNLNEIYEQYCKEVGMGKDDPIIAFVARQRALIQAAPEVRPHLSLSSHPP